jgi:MoxR-like ATPase
MSVFESVDNLRVQLQSSIIGQEVLINRMLIALLVDGHLLVEGAPGLAKTRAIKTLAEHIEADYQRVQFTPDLLPADLTGTEVYRPADGTFLFQRGPLFNNLILADEINRAPAKVQSALLEAMAEQQISVGHETYPLPALFMVMATQNPIEQEGTYPLPEAQLDRFLMHVLIDYPDASHEADILRLVREEAMVTHRAVNKAAANQAASGEAAAGSDASADATSTGNTSTDEASNAEAISVNTTLAPRELPAPTLTLAEIFSARCAVLDVHLAENIENYIVRLVTASRQPAEQDAKLARWLSYGASPRGTIALDACARAHAWLAGRDYVSPADVQAVIHDVLRHRLLLSYEAEADGVTSVDVIDHLLQLIAVP